MGALGAPRLTPDEYIEIDRKAELKSEFHDGEMFPIAAVSFRHSRIAVALASVLHSRLRGGPCSVGVSPVRIRVSTTQYVYPDVVVVCGEPQFTDDAVDTITNPKAIAEVLSLSTGDYDQAGKFKLYRKLPTFTEYLLVSQDEVKVEVYRKQSERFWVLEIVEGMEGSVKLESLSIEFPLMEIYDGISLEPR